MTYPRPPATPSLSAQLPRTARSPASVTNATAAITATVTGAGATATTTGAKIPAGGGFTLTAKATGFMPAASSYQWYLVNFAIPGATASTYTVADATAAADAGAYAVDMKTPAGEIVTSAAFTVTVSASTSGTNGGNNSGSGSGNSGGGGGGGGAPSLLYLAAATTLLILLLCAKRR